MIQQYATLSFKAGTKLSAGRQTLFHKFCKYDADVLKTQIKFEKTRRGGRTVVTERVVATVAVYRVTIH